MKISPPVPKEHGSWAMLITPLLLGMVISPIWHWRVVILFVAALGFFLARFPLATLVKTRKRASDNRSYLWRWAGIYGGLAALSGGWLILVDGLWWLAPMGIIGVLLVVYHLWLVSRNQHMSINGEISGILGLALGAPMAYYAASGQLDQTATLLWIINALYFGGTVFYIKLKVRQQPRYSAPTEISKRLVKAKACLAYHTVAFSVVILLVTLRQAPLLAPLALVPALIKVVYGALKWQDRKSLNIVRLGMVEVVHTVVFAGLVIAAF